MKKLSLEIDALAVESFETGAGASLRATVRGHRDPQPTPPVLVDDCTCEASCLCPSNAYYCGTAPATEVSCDYTANASCVYDTFSNAVPADSVEICEVSPNCFTNFSCGGASCNICTRFDSCEGCV